MLGSCCVVYVIAILMGKVSLEVTVREFVGESAVLPCSYAGDKNKVQTVNWLYNDKEHVCEFSPGVFPREVKYNVRAEPFPEEYASGKYSIKINKLEKTDAGVYTCIITPADYYANIQLIVDTKESSDIEGENERTPISPWIIALIVIIIILLFCGAAWFLIFLWRKRKTQVI